MTTDKRTKEIKIRLTDEEHQQLQGFAGGQQLASWLRELGLARGETGHRKTATPSPKVDPVLLRQIVGIGNNMNQIARRINAGEWDFMDAANIRMLLVSIERELIEIREANTRDR